MAKWVLKRSKINTEQAAVRLNLSEAVVTVLANRGIETYSDVIQFIKPEKAKQADPYQMKDMEKAVGITLQCIKDKVKIAIFGDYDVDGVMSGVILIKALKDLAAQVIYYTPHRMAEGYGLNETAIYNLNKEGVHLIIACDNGIASIREAELAKELGMELVILDHHEPGKDMENQDILPDAAAVVDPKQSQCPYVFKHLCAAGISYRFVQALYQALDKQCPEETDLKAFAAMATVCDIVDLTGENRTLVKEGLKYLAKSKNKGLKALTAATNFNIRNISTYQIGFVLGPCINAAGRLASAELAAELFLTDKDERAGQIAAQLTQLNQQRKDLTVKAVDKWTAYIENSAIKKDKVFVLYDDEMHESIAGIVAGRIKDIYYHPVVMITAGELSAKGSARSIPGYNIFEALSAVKDLFLRFGGHAQAAGLSIETSLIDELRERLNKNCNLKEEDFIPIIQIDKQLPLSQINFKLYNELRELEPFGKGNPSPVFGEKNVQVTQITYVGKEKDIIKFNCMWGAGGTITALSFSGYQQFVVQVRQRYQADEQQRILNGGKVQLALDIVYHVEVNEFNGARSLQLHLIDFRLS